MHKYLLSSQNTRNLLKNSMIISTIQPTDQPTDGKGGVWSSTSSHMSICQHFINIWLVVRSKCPKLARKTKLHQIAPNRLTDQPTDQPTAKVVYRKALLLIKKNIKYFSHLTPITYMMRFFMTQFRPRYYQMHNGVFGVPQNISVVKKYCTGCIKLICSN